MPGGPPRPPSPWRETFESKFRGLTADLTGRLALEIHERLARHYPDIAQRSGVVAEEWRNHRDQKVAYEAMVAAVGKVEEDLGQLRPPWSVYNLSELPQPKDALAWWTLRPEHRSFPHLEAWHSIGYKPVPLVPSSHRYYLMLQAMADVQPVQDSNSGQTALPLVAHSAHAYSMGQYDRADEIELNVHGWTLKHSTTGWPEPDPRSNFGHDFNFERGDWMPVLELWHKYGYKEAAQSADPLQHPKHK
jgi:hypothetical protein